MKKLINLLFLVIFTCGISSVANATKNDGGAQKHVLNAQVAAENKPIRFYGTAGQKRLTWKDVSSCRYNSNSKSKYRRLGIKDRFYEFVKENAPGKTPEILFTFQKGKVMAGNMKGVSFAEAMSTLNDGAYFLKRVNGECGYGIYLIEKKGNNLEINRGTFSLDDLNKNLMANKFILQEKVIQHPDLAKLNPSTTNTLRIVTTHFNEKTHLLAATLRMGSKKEAWVDNASQGGTFVGIDGNTGTLMEWGYYLKRRVKEKKHPISQIEYKGYRVPYFQEAVELVKQLHDKCDYYNTLGWDVVITEDGPKVLEVNIAYGLETIQWPHGRLKVKFEQLKLAKQKLLDNIFDCVVGGRDTNAYNENLGKQ